MFKYSIGNIETTDNQIYRKCFAVMHPEKQQKILRLKNKKQQKLSLLGEWLAKKLIAEESGVPAEKLVFQANEKGKPYCTTIPDIFFSISHSEEYCIAVIADRETGTDIEKIRPVSLKLSRRVCTENELLYVFGHLPSEDDYNVPFPHPYYNRFLEIWTGKEAYFKCIGTGITNFKSIDTLQLAEKTMFVADGYIIHTVMKPD